MSKKFLARDKKNLATSKKFLAHKIWKKMSKNTYFLQVIFKVKNF